MKPRNPKSFGGGKYFFKATTNIRVESNPVGKTWGMSEYIGIIRKVEQTARDEASRRYSVFDVDPPEVVFVFEDDVEYPDEIFTEFC